MLDSSKLAQLLNPKLSFYSTDKQELIDAYLMLMRSGEENEMLECEMKNVICYYEKRVEMLSNAIDNPSQLALECERGARALLLNLLQDARQHLDKCRQLFSNCLHQSSVSSSLSEINDSDISSESNSDCDSDSEM